MTNSKRCVLTSELVAWQYVLWIKRIHMPTLYFEAVVSGSGDSAFNISDLQSVSYLVLAPLMVDEVRIYHPLVRLRPSYVLGLQVHTPVQIVVPEVELHCIRLIFGNYTQFLR